MNGRVNGRGSRLASLPEVRAPVRTILLLGVAAGASGLSACGGGDGERAAQRHSLCVAKESIERHAAELRARSIGGITLGRLRSHRAAILKDLERIVSSSEAVDEAARKSIERGADRFGAAIEQAGDSVKTLPQTAIVLNAAVQQLIAAVAAASRTCARSGSRRISLRWRYPHTSRLAHGAAVASCTSASRSTKSG
jgi:hypothetical protein